MNTNPAGKSLVKITIAFCALTALGEGIDLQAAGLAAAGIGAELSPSPEKMANFFSASTLGLFIGAIIGGRIADSIGRRAVLITSVALFGLFSILTAAAGSIAMLTVARFLTGLGLGGAMPMMLAYVSETASPQRQRASVAMVYAVTPFGGAFASLISVFLATNQWRVIFVIGGVVPLVVAAFMLAYLKESVGFTRVDKSAKRGSFTAVFANGRALETISLWVSFFLALLLLYLLLNWLPTLMIADGMTRAQAAGTQIGFNIGGVLSAVLIGYLMEGRLRNRAVAIVFIAVPLLLVALAKAPPLVPVLMLMVFVLGCAVLAAQAFLYAMAPSAYPVAIRGVGVGMAVAMGRIGSIAGPKLGGALKAAGHSPSQLFMDLLPIVILGSICALWLAWQTRRPQSPALAV